MKKLLLLASLLIATNVYATDDIYREFLENKTPNQIDYFGYKLKISQFDNFEQKDPGLGYSVKYSENPSSDLYGCKVTTYLYDDNNVSFHKNEKGLIGYKEEKQNTQPITKEILPYHIGKIAQMLKYFYKDIKNIEIKTTEKSDLFFLTAETKDTDEAVLLTTYKGNFFKVRTTCLKNTNKEKIDAGALGIFVLTTLRSDLEKYLKKN